MPSVYRKVGEMLKITHDDTAGKERWTLCGRLSEPWVGELRAAWQRIGGRSNKTYVVDLTGVVSIDEQGEDLLRAMKADGARFVARGVDMKHILAHLRSKTRRPLRRALVHLDRNGDCS